jgi:hypothetical protein
VEPGPWSEEIRAILAQERANGGPCWSRVDGNVHAPAGFSTLLVLNVLGELGARVTTDERIAAAAELVLAHQAPDGTFRYAPGSAKLPCIAGQALAALGRLGLAGDPRVEAGYRRLLDEQHDDGGWRCPTVALGRSPETDASNPGATIFVLDAFRFRSDGRDAEERLARAVGSLLRHWETRAPLGPCAFGIGSRFLRVEYPFWRYNLFYVAYVLSHYAAARGDPRFAEVVGELRRHVRDGRLVVDAPPRAWVRYGFARPGRPSELATERLRELDSNLARTAP